MKAVARRYQLVAVLRSLVCAMTAVGLAACGNLAGSGSAASPARSAAPNPSSTLGPPSSPLAAPACSSAQLLITVASDRPTYRAGQVVTLTVNLQNTGESPCDVPTGSCLPQIVISNSGGTVVWDRAAMQVMCTFGNPHTLGPGASAAQTVSWDGTLCAGRDPESCPGGPVSPGTYHVLAKWNTTRYGTVTFVVTS